jgi:hypothetical protein
MSYTQSDLNYYKKNPSHITATLDDELLLTLIDFNAGNIKYIKPQSFELIQAAYARDPAVFKYIDMSMITVQFLEHVIETNPVMIQHVYSPTPELMKFALVKDLNVLQYIEKYLDEDMYKWLLSQNGLVLEFIPAGKQTEELVMIAIQENLEAYKYANVKTKVTDIYVIEQDPTKISMLSKYWPELIETLIQYNPRFITKFYDQPEIVTEEFMKMAISLDPDVFRTIPDPDFEIMKHTVGLDIGMLDYMPYNQNLIDYAISINGLALRYIRKKDLRTIKNALMQNVMSLEYVEYPRQFMIDFAFKHNGLALKYIETPTYDQCLDAVKRNPFAVEFVPDEFRTKDLQLYALMAGVAIIPFLGEPADDEVVFQILRIDPGFIFKIEIPTSAMYITAFKATGRLILFYPNWNDKFGFPEISGALEQDGTIFDEVRDKTKKLARVAIEQYPPALQWVDFQDLELARLAVGLDPRTIYFVDKDILDSELLTLAVTLDPDFYTRTSGEMTWEQWLDLIEYDKRSKYL